ncbi:Protein of unknown function [Lactobacillus delbrueckii subsp. lactis]|nr:Protein of unknown function [Lactobacillus delbrueckii subsp. lactis]
MESGDNNVKKEKE